MSKQVEASGWRLLRYLTVAAVLVLAPLAFATTRASATGLESDSGSCAYGPCSTTTLPGATTVPQSGGNQHSPATEPSATSKSSGGLAFTGTDAATLAAVGSFLVLAGGLVILLSHRRRRTA